MRICIDPGHGGKDPGAIGLSGLHEADVNLQVALILRTKLEASGHKVKLTRILDEFIELRDRCLMSNASDSDLFISLHCNAAANRSASGIEAWTTPGRTKSDEWADKILVELTRAFPHESLRRDTADGDLDKEGHLYVLAHTSAPAVLVEMGFISHPETELRMHLPSWRDNAAHAIASAVGLA